MKYISCRNPFCGNIQEHSTLPAVGQPNPEHAAPRVPALPKKQLLDPGPDWIPSQVSSREGLLGEGDPSQLQWVSSILLQVLAGSETRKQLRSLSCRGGLGFDGRSCHHPCTPHRPLPHSVRPSSSPKSPYSWLALLEAGQLPARH